MNTKMFLSDLCEDIQMQHKSNKNNPEYMEMVNSPPTF